MAAEVILKRPLHQKALISLVPMIDVMLILLVFFMVTSTYLNLDMIPALSRTDQSEEASPPTAEQGGTLLIRLGADGVPVIRGRELEFTELGGIIRTRTAQNPRLSVIVLPTGGANMQALVSLMDTLTSAGATKVRIIRLETRS